MARFEFTDAQVAQFHEDGYLVVPGFLDAAETDLLLRVAKGDQALADGAADRTDAEGNTTRLTLRNDLGDNMYSAIVRSERLVRNMERLLGGEVYHYHHKMMLKEPRVGGAWEWHQDYGYWYNNGCLFPDMASCMIAVDHATRENGCLQVIRGSHRMGRIDHGQVGTNQDQTGADLERVEQALKRLELVYAELEPGTALFFHGNLLHRSDANRSERPRWTLICCYNTKANDPYKEHGHPCYSPLEVWPDDRVRAAGERHRASTHAGLP